MPATILTERLVAVRSNRREEGIISEDNPEDLDRTYAAHLEYFADRINLLFSYHFWVLEFRGDEDIRDNVAYNDRTWALMTMKNACLHTSLIALRDLDDFLTPRSSR